MTLDDLRLEYEREVIGRQIYAEISAIARQVVRNYDPHVYAQAGDWASALEDLLQEVVLERLLGEGQLAYAMTVAADETHWRLLIARQVRRALARRRQRSVIDNLLERADTILAREPFVTAITGRVVEHWSAAGMPEDRRPTEEEIRSAIAAAAGVPITRGHGDERAPMVYSSAALEALLIAVANTLPCKFTKGDLDRILRGLLTQWLGGDLVDIEGVLQLPSESLTPEELAEVNDTANRVLEAIDPQGRYILRAKLNDQSDGEIATLLGLSRPTVASRKDAVLRRLQGELEGMPSDSANAVVMRLAALLTEPRWSES